MNGKMFMFVNGLILHFFSFFIENVWIDYIFQF